MTDNFEVINSEIGEIVVFYDKKYHMYTAYFKNNPSKFIKTRFRNSIVTSLGRTLKPVVA